MASNKCLKDFICALSNDEHFVKQPILLSCTHCICKKCALIAQSTIKCTICGNINNIDFNCVEESTEIRLEIQNNLKPMLQTIANKIKKAIKKIKGVFIFTKLENLIF